MKVIDRLTITPAMVSTNAVNAHADWDGAATYAEGDRRVYGQYVYESLQAANTGKQPDTEGTWWVKVGPSNKWAAFDTALNTVMTGSSPLEVEITAGAPINSAAFLNLDGTALRVELYDGSEVVYDREFSLDGTIILDWYMYFFEPYNLLTEMVVTDIPPYASGTLVATLTSASGVAIGAVIVGTVYEVGVTQYGVNFGIRDYSVKEEDEFGNIELVERNFAKRMEPVVIVENASLNFVSRLLTRLRARPTVFIASEEDRYQPLIVFGTLRDWNVEIPYPRHSVLRLEVNGLI